VPKRLDCRRVKIHHSYTISDLSAAIGVHKHTIRRWIDAGLPTTDDKRPLLIHGADFRAFMNAQKPTKQRCQPGEFFCLRCRAPRRPALDMADYYPRSALRGLLSGICSECGKMIYRATTLAKLNENRGGLDVAYPKAQQRLDDSGSPNSNADFNEVPDT
jgi:hypothetical protein